MSLESCPRKNLSLYTLLCTRASLNLTVKSYSRDVGNSLTQMLSQHFIMELSVLSMKDLCSIHRNMTVWFGIPIVNLQN